MKRRTKIVCTLGPSVSSREKIVQLVRAGMNVARFNCSHGDWATRDAWLEHLRSAEADIGPVGVLVDLQGPKFRIGALPEGLLDIRSGQTLTIGRGSGATVQVPGDEMFAAMAPGSRLLLGDGDVELRLLARNGDAFDAKAVSGGQIRSRQGLTLVGKSFDVPPLTDKDREDLVEAAKRGADFIALSYVRRASDLEELRALVDQHDPGIKLCAKIETQEALTHIGEVVRAADIVMVARGDLGLQIELEDVPMAQKAIIRKCAQAGKPVITATQMLESMVEAPRPTRAEAADVANAILDGTDAVMLSGETAAGAYPIEAVQTMGRIIAKAEAHFDYGQRAEAMECGSGVGHSTEAVAEAAAQMACTLKARALVTTTTSGLTPRMVAKYRPKCPILSAATNRQVQRQLSAVWGVEAALVIPAKGTDEAIRLAIDAFRAAKRLMPGHVVVVTAGVPAGSAGHTNLIKVETVR